MNDSLSFDLIDRSFLPTGIPAAAVELLPGPFAMLHRTPFIDPQTNWDNFWTACKELRTQIGNIRYLYIDAFWDPVPLSNDEIISRRQELMDLWPETKVLILSARAQHHFDDLPGCLYFPMFLMHPLPPLIELPRAGRIGCLNRRFTAHRIWMMHNLLDQQLIDSERDVFSISFVNIYDNQTWFDVDGQIGTNWVNQAVRQWPPQIQTHPDNFINDYSINHPAWHTGIAIITETQPGANTLISEKTAKGIVSKSCFSIYMGEVGYRLLEDLGFEPRFFHSHAENFDIQPVLDICKTITTEAQALDYRSQHLDQIHHNFSWFGSLQEPFADRPWFALFRPKLKQALERL